MILFAQDSSFCRIVTQIRTAIRRKEKENHLTRNRFFIFDRENIDFLRERAVHLFREDVMHLYEGGIGAFSGASDPEYRCAAVFPFYRPEKKPDGHGSRWPPDTDSRKLVL